MDVLPPLLDSQVHRTLETMKHRARKLASRRPMEGELAGELMGLRQEVRKPAEYLVQTPECTLVTLSGNSWLTDCF
jgi:hypothetical protein